MSKNSIPQFQFGERVTYTAPSGRKYVAYVGEIVYEQSYVIPTWESYCAYLTDAGWMTGWIAFGSLEKQS